MHVLYPSPFNPREKPEDTSCRHYHRCRPPTSWHFFFKVFLPLKFFSRSAGNVPPPPFCQLWKKKWKIRHKFLFLLFYAFSCLFSRILMRKWLFWAFLSKCSIFISKLPNNISLFFSKPSMSVGEFWLKFYIFHLPPQMNDILPNIPFIFSLKKYMRIVGVLTDIMFFLQILQFNILNAA